MRPAFVNKTIDGYTYEIYTLPPSRALKIGTRLVKLIGDPLGKAAAAFKMEAQGSVMDSKVNMDLIGQAIASLAERLDEDQVLSTIQELMEDVRLKGQPIHFDGDHFAGRTKSLLKVVGAVLEVNYSDFLPAASGLRAAVARAMGQAQGSPAQSTGESGGSSVTTGSQMA